MRRHGGPPQTGILLACRALVLTLLAGSSACVTVRAQQRAVLADPVMQFDSEPHGEAMRVHAIENREGSFGGSGVAGGGCGCN